MSEYPSADPATGPSTDLARDRLVANRIRRALGDWEFNAFSAGAAAQPLSNYLVDADVLPVEIAPPPSSFLRNLAGEAWQAVSAIAGLTAYAFLAYHAIEYAVLSIETIVRAL
jgi:hypothetical protein